MTETNTSGSATDEEGSSTNEEEYDRDVLVVGGSAAGLAVGLFTARNDLDTLIVRGGHNTLLRCSILENYLGLPNVEPSTYLSLATEHARDAGCTVENARVEQLQTNGQGFVAETEGREISCRRVVVASGSENEYLTEIADGELYNGPATHENFNYYVPCDKDGRTAVDGLYAAGRLAGAEHQALAAAGHGAQVGLAVVRDSLRVAGYWDELVEKFYDWSVMPHRHEDWDIDEWFDEQVPDDAELDDTEIESLRAAYRERIEKRARDEDAVKRQRDRGRELLSQHLLEE
jgi:alkyl hydroperoxide reductase subunit AhpF